MIALSNRRRVVAFAWLELGALLVAACSIDSVVDPLAACIEGQSASCDCAGAPLGVRVCGANGEFGTCQCVVPSTGGVGGVMPPIHGGMGGQGVVVAGTSADPVVDAGLAGSGGTGGSDDGGIVSTGGVGGSIGPAGSGGMAGEATGGSPVVDEPGPGEMPYGECRDDGSCDLPMLCVFDLLTGGAERYCASICNGNGLGAFGCPPRADGSLVFCVNNLCMR